MLGLIQSSNQSGHRRIFGSDKRRAGYCRFHQECRKIQQIAYSNMLTQLARLSNTLANRRVTGEQITHLGDKALLDFIGVATGEFQCL